MRASRINVALLRPCGFTESVIEQRISPSSPEPETRSITKHWKRSGYYYEYDHRGSRGKRMPEEAGLRVVAQLAIRPSPLLIARNQPCRQQQGWSARRRRQHLTDCTLRKRWTRCTGYNFRHPDACGHSAVFCYGTLFLTFSAK